VPSRGEVWLADLGMIQKVRPALILNREFKDTDRALISVIPPTTALRGSDREIRVKVPFLQPGGFLVQNPMTIAATKNRAMPWPTDIATIGPGGSRRAQLARPLDSEK
jgi:mRNA interferase MazF